MALLFSGVELLFVVWVVFLGGAEWFEDTLASAFWIHPGSLRWGATGIKILVGGSWLGARLLDLLSIL